MAVASSHQKYINCKQKLNQIERNFEKLKTLNKIESNDLKNLPPILQTLYRSYQSQILDMTNEKVKWKELYITQRNNLVSFLRNLSTTDKHSLYEFLLYLKETSNSKYDKNFAMLLRSEIRLITPQIQIPRTKY